MHQFSVQSLTGAIFKRSFGSVSFLSSQKLVLYTSLSSARSFHHSYSSSMSATTSTPSTTAASTASTAASASAAHTETNSTTTDPYKDSGKYRVYTKTGDAGTSSLFNMQRKPKDDEFFQALGDTDELNANLGVCREYLVAQGLSSTAQQLEEIQSRLFDVGSHIATPRTTSTAAQKARTEFADEHTAQLEKWIDEMEVELPALKNFILPSGGLASAHLHVARAVCRRAERRIVPIVAHGDAELCIQKYLNRLSDYLFVCARFACLKAGNTETIWKKPRVTASSSTSSTTSS